MFSNFRIWIGFTAVKDSFHFSRSTSASLQILIYCRRFHSIRFPYSIICTAYKINPIKRRVALPHQKPIKTGPCLPNVYLHIQARQVNGLS